MSRSVKAPNLQPKSSVKTCVDSVRKLQSFENDLGLQDRFLSLFTLFRVASAVLLKPLPYIHFSCKGLGFIFYFILFIPPHWICI